MDSTPLSRRNGRSRRPVGDQGQSAPGNGGRSVRIFLSDADWDRIRGRLSLSARETELVQHIFAGKKLGAIAWDMGIAVGTIKTYSMRIHQKLRISDQRELILSVMQAHLDQSPL